MAKKDKKSKLKDSLEDLKNKTSSLVYGTNETLETENEDLKNIVRQTVISTSELIGKKANGKVINYFNELNLGNTFSEILNNNKEENSKNKNSNAAFKEYMANQDLVDVNNLLLSENSRLMIFSDYKAIFDHIPECAQGLETYKNNILSPDDFTKLIFDIKFDDNSDADLKKKIEDQLENLGKKYKIDEKADKIVEETLKLGEQYISVLSLEEELSNILSTKINLNEDNIAFFDEKVFSAELDETSVLLNENNNSLFNEFINTENSLEKNKKIISKIINENIKIGSKKEILLEKFEAEKEREKFKTFSSIDIESEKEKRKKKRNKNNDSKPLYINGSSVKILDPSKVIELKIEDTCYGYYYAEEITNNIPNASYLGVTTGREVNQTMNIAGNNTIAGTTGSTYTPGNPAAKILNTSEEKLRLISQIFIDNIATKVDKNFIRKNKKFKEFIFDLLKQDYIIKKGIKLIYFSPGDIIKFEATPVFKKIVFFAKLYLSVLTNNLLIKLGRAHDKRIFYINVGADANYEQAISKVIQDIKTKDYKMDNLLDFNTLLNLNPGRFDDYFMPTINGEKPIEIDTLQGMDIEMENEFVVFLKSSMINGMGLPPSLIDAVSQVDFARTLSAQNGNFLRAVIKYQKNFTEPFNELYKKLYINEYKYSNNKESESLKFVNIENIVVKFPSPASLNMTNLSEQISSVDGNADFISSQIIIPKQTGENEDERLLLKSEIIKDLLPSIDWEKYEEFRKNIELKTIEEEIKEKGTEGENPDFSTNFM